MADNNEEYSNSEFFNCFMKWFNSKVLSAKKNAKKMNIPTDIGEFQDKFGTNELKERLDKLEAKMKENMKNENNDTVAPTNNDDSTGESMNGGRGGRKRKSRKRRRTRRKSKKKRGGNRKRKNKTRR